MRTRGRKKAPRTGGHTCSRHSGIWNADQHRRPSYEAPFLGSFPTGRNIPPTPRIPVVPLPEAGTTPAFSQPLNAPWIEPNIFLPGVQRTSQDPPNPIWQRNFSQKNPGINSQHIPQAHSRWASPWMNYDSLGSWPPIQKNIYKVPVIHQEGHTVNSSHQAGYNGREGLPHLLRKGGLKWDIRFPPSTSQFDPVRSFNPNLELPALSESIQEVEICFPRAMKCFTSAWGSFPVRRRYGSSAISIRDILEATYQYFMQPLRLGEAERFYAVPDQKEEMVMAYSMRQWVQGEKDYRYRRCDLLQNGRCNFNFLEIETEGRDFVRLQLHLY